MAFDKVSVWLPAKLRAVPMGKKSTSQYCVAGKTTKITALAPDPSVFAPGRLGCSISAQEQQIVSVSFGFPIIPESQKVSVGEDLKDRLVLCPVPWARTPST